MRADRRVAAACFVAVLWWGNVWAQSGADQGASPPPAAEEEKPEFTRRSLPTDTFKPSEEISEDFPVPFPVDI